MVACFTQCARRLDHLFEFCRKKVLPDDIGQALLVIVERCMKRDCLAAMDQYIRLAIDTAPWPTGATMVGVHERSAREKMFTNGVARTMNTDTTRRYLGPIKRLMTFCELHYPALAPTSDRGGGVVDDDRGPTGGGAGEDHISGLSDHLLHTILLLLVRGGIAAEAARTSVLSRRWRHVWAHLPELALRYHHKTGMYARVHERVDAALAAYSAPTLRRLEIAVPYGSPCLTSGRVSSWLRLAGDLLLSLPHRVPDGDREEILIPPCQRATAIHIEHVRRTLRFLPLLPVAGGVPAFAALATLRIKDAMVDSRELEDVLSSRCPRLKELALEYVTLRDGPAVFCISSGSLQRLEVASSDELRVAAPELQVLTQQFISCDAYISAPKLSQLYWYDLCYDPSRHRFAEAGRHLRRTKVTTGSPSMALMKRFDIIDELDLTLYVPQGVQQYEKLLEGTSKLAKWLWC